MKTIPKFLLGPVEEKEKKRNIEAVRTANRIWRDKSCSGEEVYRLLDRVGRKYGISSDELHGEVLFYHYYQKEKSK
jgi:hypothetical protein